VCWGLFFAKRWVFSCLGRIPPPLPPKDFREGSCGFLGVFEQIRLVLGLFLAVVIHGFGLSSLALNGLVSLVYPRSDYTPETVRRMVVY